MTWDQVAGADPKISASLVAAIRADVAKLADLTSDLAQWMGGLVKQPGVVAALRAGGMDAMSMRQNQTMLFAIHAGASEIAERLRPDGDTAGEDGQ